MTYLGADSLIAYPVHSVVVHSRECFAMTRWAPSRWTTLLLTACVAGAAAGYWLSLRDSGADRPESVAGAIRSSGNARSPAAATQHTTLQSVPESDPKATRSRHGQSVERSHTRASEFARRSALYEAVAHADDARVQTLIDETGALANQNERLPALELLLLRVAERDPESAVRQALQSERTDTPRLIAALSAAAPEPVWRAVSRVGDPLARLEYQSAAAAAWAAQDPQSAFASVAGLPADWTREQLMRQLTSEITRSNPHLAIDLAKTVPDPEGDRLLDAVADTWGRHDPGAAAEWIEAMDVNMQGRFAYRIADAYVAQQPEEALSWALRISRSPGKNLWSQMIGHMATYDPNDALRRAMAADNPAQRNQAMSRALTAIAARDPALAMRHLEKLPAGRARTRASMEVGMQIAQVHPGTAIDWLREIDDPRTRMEVGGAIAGQLAGSDVEMAAQLIDRVPKEMRAPWIMHVAHAYANLDVEKGVQWVSSHRDDAHGVIQQFSQAVAMRNPDSAWDVAERLTDGKDRDQILGGVLATIAQQSPESAARHVKEISNDAARALAAGSVASAWARYDGAAARKWVLSLESGQMREMALAQMIPSLVSLDDQLSLIGELQSPDQRLNVVFNTAVNMAHSDPEGMRTLLRRYPLDPQRQQQVDAIVQKGTRGW
jgi:hypothetical protein